MQTKFKPNGDSGHLGFTLILVVWSLKKFTNGTKNGSYLVPGDFFARPAFPQIIKMCRISNILEVTFSVFNVLNMGRVHFNWSVASALKHNSFFTKYSFTNLGDNEDDIEQQRSFKASRHTCTVTINDLTEDEEDQNERAQKEEDEQTIKLRKSYTWPVRLFKKKSKGAQNEAYHLNVDVPVPSHFDLLALLDKSRRPSNLALGVLLSTCVNVLAACVFMSEDMYGFANLTNDTNTNNTSIFDLLLFCFILASCQYSLLKSPQPDTSSPIHGFNTMTSFSRPAYFCLSLVIIVPLSYYCSQTTETCNLKKKLNIFKGALRLKCHFKT